MRYLVVGSARQPATDLLLDSPEATAQFLNAVPLARWGRVEEVGQLAVYLCADSAAFITGTDILIDGGWCAK